MLLEFQKDELLVSHIPGKVEHTKSVIDTLHDAPVPALTRMLSELNLNDNKELIYRETVLEEQFGRRAPGIENSPGHKKHYEELFREIIDPILNYVDKINQNFPNNHFCKWWKYSIYTASWASTFPCTKELRTWRNEDSNINYLIWKKSLHNKENQLAIQQWQLFWQIVLQRKQEER